MASARALALLVGLAGCTGARPPPASPAPILILPAVASPPSPASPPQEKGEPPAEPAEEAPPRFDCTSVPPVDGPDGVRTIVETSGLAALPCVWAQLGVRSTAFDDAIAQGRACVDQGGSCAVVADLPGSPPGRRYAAVRIHEANRGEVHHWLAFDVAGKAPRFLGAFEATTHWLDPGPSARVEAFAGRSPFVAVPVSPHVGTGLGNDREVWFDLERVEGGSLKEVLEVPLHWWSISTDNPVVDMEVRGRIVGRALDGGEPAVDVAVEEIHQGFSWGAGKGPAKETTIFDKKAVVRFRFDSRSGVFGPVARRSTLRPAEIEAMLHGYRSCAAMVEENLPRLLAVLQRGSPAQRTYVRRFAEIHQDDESCTATPAFATLRAASRPPPAQGALP